MYFGIIGLGRMGMNLATQAIEKGHEVAAFDLRQSARSELDGLGGTGATSLHALKELLPAPRILLIYVPHGDPTEQVCMELAAILEQGDIVADCGNSHWADSRRRHGMFAEKGIPFLDIGTSGGLAGARRGAAFMAGGDAQPFEAVRPLLVDLAVDETAVYLVGPPGAGHFVKLIHNAIEFGMIQSIAEGVEMLMRSDYDVDLPALFDHWGHGSVIRSWLVELMGKALAEEPKFEDLSSYVEDTDEVKWVLDWALKQDIPAPSISAAQIALMQYRDLDWPAAKAVALLRNAFGAHPVHRRNGRGRE